MKPNEIQDLREVIDSSSAPVVVLVIAEGCENVKPTAQDLLEKELIRIPHPVTYRHICVSEEEMSFPRYGTPALYFFLPKNQTPVFWRTMGIMSTLEKDIETVYTMMTKQVSYEEARFEPEDFKKIQEVDDFLQKEEKNMTSFPSAFQQARGLAKEMWKASKVAAKGLPVLVDAETGFQRFSTCQSCEHFEKSSNRCKQCGCFMKTKTQLASASCPVGKWKAIV